MEKYILIAKNTWVEMVTYRLNFVMWRIRTALQLLTIYFLWLALIPENKELFGYSQSLMLTYIFGVSFLSAIVLSTRTHEIGENINKGDLSTFLVRPINYFNYWFARDMGDKILNILFSIAEIVLLFFILQPPLYVQTNIFYLSYSLLAVILGVFLYFLFGSLMGMIGFWSPEVWAPRFILFVLLSFLSGSLFPLDILPRSLFAVFELTPFPYLLYFPLKIYLGQLSAFSINIGILISIIWIGILYVILKFVWNKGLKMYTAVGG